jgi:multidrug efflux pump subunit AcrB
MKAWNREEAAWRSATELAIPVLTATLTIICSFLPFLMLSGATGEFIRALPLTVAIALSTSFLVAMVLTPLLAISSSEKAFITRKTAETREEAPFAARTHAGRSTTA